MYRMYVMTAAKKNSQHLPPPPPAVKGAPVYMCVDVLPVPGSFEVVPLLLLCATVTVCGNPCSKDVASQRMFPRVLDSLVQRPSDLMRVQKQICAGADYVLCDSNA